MNVGVLRGRCEATHVALKHFFEQVLKLLEALFCIPHLHKTPHHPKKKENQSNSKGHKVEEWTAWIGFCHKIHYSFGTSTT